MIMRKCIPLLLYTILIYQHFAFCGDKQSQNIGSQLPGANNNQQNNPLPQHPPWRHPPQYSNQQLPSSNNNPQNNPMQHHAAHYYPPQYSGQQLPDPNNNSQNTLPPHPPWQPYQPGFHQPYPYYQGPHGHHQMYYGSPYNVSHQPYYDPYGQPYNGVWYFCPQPPINANNNFPNEMPRQVYEEQQAEFQTPTPVKDNNSDTRKKRTREKSQGEEPTKRPKKVTEEMPKKRKKTEATQDGLSSLVKEKVRVRKYPKIELIVDEKSIGDDDLFSWAYWYENLPQPDFNQARRHYEKAIFNSANGKPDERARFKMAQHCENGTCGVKQNARKAHEYYETAANGGCSEAQFKVGLYYEYGRCGFPQNIAEAIRWYVKAADNPNESLEALVNLGILYETGIDGEVSHEKALNYYNRAADKGSGDAQYRLSLVFRSETNGLKDLTKADDLLRRASNNGSAEAANDLAMKFEEEGNDKEAIRLYTLASGRGLKEAHFNLGVCYEEGTMIDRNLAKAKEHFKLAGNYQPAVDALVELEKN